MKSDYASSRSGAWRAAALLIGGVAACGGVALDALAAHAFKQRLDAHDLGTLATTARYLTIHGLMLIVVGGWLQSLPATRVLKGVVLSAATGIVLFCVGLSAKVVSGTALYGAAAPYGGTAFMLAWLGCALHAITGPRPSP